MDRPYYFQKEFLTQMMSDYAHQTIEVLEVIPFSLDNSASILAVLTAGNSSKPIGHFGLKIAYRCDGVDFSIDSVLKVKPHGEEISTMLNGLASIPHTALEDIYSKHQHETGFRNVHMRELEVYQKLKPDCSQKVYGVHADEENGLFFILMESLLETNLLNTVMEPERWTHSYIVSTINSLANFHIDGLAEDPVEGFQSTASLTKDYWDDVANKSYMVRLSPLWSALLNQAASEFPTLYSSERKAIMESYIKDIPNYWSEMETFPMTLIHNDCNPRNMCFKVVNGEQKLCLYDWELTSYHTPVYDIIEFLTFVLDKDRYDLWPTYLNHYFAVLEKLGNPYMDRSQFYQAVQYAARDYGLHRLGLYMMAHAVAPYPFLPRVVDSYFHFVSYDHKSLLKSAYLVD